MEIQNAIRAVTERRDLSGDDMHAVMRQIMTGNATPAQIGGFLIGLRMKGETVEEITAAVRVMRELATRVEVRGTPLIDCCGTGGDGAATFNISTTCAFVAAAAGAKVAKHGNRSISSQCGSADVLEAAGLDLDLTPEQVAHCIDKIGVGFMFAPKHHGAMKHAIGPRKEMGVRTLFNLLGPLTNPAGATHQLIGVFSAAWLEPIAQVLQKLGSKHVLVVHSQDGLDEIALSNPTDIAELRDGAVRRYTVDPTTFGMKRHPIEALRVSSAAESLAKMRAALNNEAGPARDIVALNAGAAIYAADLADDFAAGVRRAQDVLASGAALATFTALLDLSRRLKKGE